MLIRLRGSLDEEGEQFKNMNNLDEELSRIQKSTKTTLPIFAGYHDRLRMKYRWYYRWHLNPYCNIINFGILTVCTLFIMFFAFSGLVVRFPTESEAAMTTATWTSQADFSGFTKSNTSETEVANSLTLLGPAPYPTSGYAYVNYDAGATKSWYTLDKTETLNSQTINYYGKTSTDATCSNAGTWTGWTALSFSGNTANLTGFSNSQYFCLGAALSTSDTAATPQIDSLTLKTVDTTDCYWTNNGGDNSWGTASNWTCAAIPDNTKDVYVDGVLTNANITIGSTATAGSITTKNSYSGTISANAALTLDNTAAKTGSFYMYDGTFTGSANSVTITGNYTQTGGTFTAPSTTLTAKTFNLSAGTYNASSGTTTIQGAFTISGSGNFDASTSTLNLDAKGSADWSFVPNNATFNNLTFTKSGNTSTTNITVTIVGNCTVNGTLTIKNDTIGGSYRAYTLAGSSSTITANGNFSIPASDVGTVTINSTVNVDLKGNFSLTKSSAYLNANITFSSATADQTITHSLGTISGGTWTINDAGYTTKLLSAVSGSANLTVTAGTFLQNGFDLSIANFSQGGGTFTSGANNLTALGTFTQTNGTFNAPSAILYTSNTFNRSGGTFNTNSGTVQMNGSSVDYAVTTGGLTFNNLTYTQGGPGAFVITLNDNFTVAGLFNIIASSSSGYTITGSAARTITVTGNLSFPTGGSAPTTLDSNITIDLSGNFNLVTQYITCKANINFINTAADQTITQNTGTISTGTWTVNKTGRTVRMLTALNLTTGANLVITDGTFLQNGFDLSVAGNFSQGGGTFTSGANPLTVSGTFTQSNGVFNATSDILTIKNTFNRSGGTFNANNGTVLFAILSNNGSYAITTGNATFYNLTFNKNVPGGLSYILTLNDDFNVGGALTITDGNSGSFTITGSAARTIAVTGNLSFTSMYNSILDSNITVNLSGNYSMTSTAGNCKANINLVNTTADQTISVAAGYITTGTWTVNKPGYTAKLISAVSFTTGASLTVTAGTFLQNGYDFSIAGNFSQGGGTYTSGANTLSITGTFTQTNGIFNAPNATNLTIYSTFNRSGGTFNHNSGTVLLDAANGNFAVTTGGLTFYNLNFIKSANNLARSITLNDGFNVAGSLTINTDRTNGFTVDGSVAISINLTGNLNFTGASATSLSANVTVNLSGNFNMTGSLASCSSSINLINTSADQTVTQSSGTIMNSAWTVNKSNYSVIQQTAYANTVGGTGYITITSGKWYTNGQNLTVKTLNNNSTLKVNGNETLTITNKDTDSGIVEYAGTGTYASLNYGNNYYDLTVSGAGSFTAAATTVINGNYSQTAGTFIAPSTWNIAGNYSHTAGTLTAGTSTLTLNGSGAQSFTAGGTTSAFQPYNLTVTNASASGVTFADSLTLSAGGTLKDITGGSHLTFNAGSTYTVPNININGATGNNIVLRSSSDNTPWLFNVGNATPTVSYVDVKDSNAAGSTRYIDASNNGTDSLGNTNWIFAPINNPTNDSLTFVDPYSGTLDTIVADNTTTWDFQAKVSDADGSTDINYVEFRLANGSDSVTPFDSLKIRWTESTDTFAVTGDTQSAITLISTNSDSGVSGNQWTLNFKFKVNDSFLNKDTLYAAELYAVDDFSLFATTNYANIYQVAALSLSLNLDTSSINFGTITPETPLLSSLISTVSTNSANGYSLSINDNQTGTRSCLAHTDTTTYIDDYLDSIATPTLWSGYGLGFSLYSATNKEAKWGTGTTYNDANNKYAGVPQNITAFHTKTGNPTVNDESKISFKVNVPNAQKTGSYSGSVTITATGVLE